ncbi:hypothetical protein CPB83DRAFT_845010 [Crepidotus variabilis]|uniref:Uncharacterized protein n=1 Tax=Crepidotus variabilis TaxID=179855 RepID=A0A9P6JUB2_9AGAR|nr:hypothetical protein CPB83DRAFT_845010 [Crepidotus variabilis]
MDLTLLIELLTSTFGCTCTKLKLHVATYKSSLNLRNKGYLRVIEQLIAIPLQREIHTNEDLRLPYITTEAISPYEEPESSQ